jgi:hypothetical protein
VSGNRLERILALLVLLLVPAKAAAWCPEWTRGNVAVPEYPRDRFFVARGVAYQVFDQNEGEKKAELEAWSSIARELRSDVASAIKMRESEVEVDGRSSGMQSSEIIGYVSTLVKDLPGGSIVSRCFEPRQGNTYVLLVVDKAVARSRLATAVAIAGRTANAETHAIENAIRRRTPMDGLAHLRPAYEAIEEMKHKLSTLVLVGGETPAELPTSGQLREVVRRLRSLLKVAVEVRGEGGQQAASAVVERLSRLGIEMDRAGDRNRGAAVTVRITISERALVPSRITNVVAAYEVVDLQVKRSDTNTIIGGFQKEVRGVGRDAGDARRIAFAEMADAIGPAVESTLKTVLAVGAEGN